MRLRIEELDMADITLVEQKGNHIYCKKHGAMVVVAIYEDGRKVWRCPTNYGKCRVGCVTSVKKWYQLR